MTQKEQTQIITSQNSNLVITYFDLINKVGADGPYQRNLFILFFCNWLITGILMMQTAFLFMNYSFQCQDNGLLSNDCKNYICLLENPQQNTFLKKQEINSITTQFGPYLCEDQFVISFAKTILYFGVFLGYLFFLFFTDNYGRKFSIVMTWGSCCAGILLLILSQNIYMASIGLFFAGSGCETSIRINMTIFGQVFDYYKRQTYSVAVQISFGLAGIMVALMYYFIKDWRIINIVFVAIPSFLILFAFIFYLQETPKFLVRQGKEKALKALNRIGKINKGVDNILTIEDIQQVIQEDEAQNKDFQKFITILDVFKFRSLRTISVCMLVIFFVLSYIYFTPSFLVDKLGFNSYVSQIVVSFSELLAYPISIPFIKIMPRVKSGIFCLFMAAIFSMIAVSYQKPVDCQGMCAESIIEIVCVFFMRFSTAFYYSILFLFVNQLYPSRARGIGFGVGSAAGAIASTLGNPIISILQSNKLSPHYLNAPLAIIAIGALTFLPQTLNKPLKDQIEEISQEKENVKSIRRSTLRESYLKKLVD